MALDDHGPLRPISLACEAPFKLGLLWVSPGTRQICGGGVSETLEPRVMQVLVALVRANGAILSRDDLVSLCWDGRIVGDNAVHRALSKVREVASGLGQGSFEVETITKVGYRLLFRPQEGTSPDSVQSSAPVAATTRERQCKTGAESDLPFSSSRPHGRNWLRPAAALSVFLLIGGLIWGSSSRTPEIPTITVLGVPGTFSDPLARELRIELARLITAPGHRWTVTEDVSDANYIVRLSVAGEAQIARLDLTLAMADYPSVLWATSVEGQPAADRDFRAELTAKIGHVLACALRPSREGHTLTADLLRLYLAACERMQAEPSEQLISLLRSLTQRAPRFLPAWEDLAIAEASRYPLVRYSYGESAPETIALRTSAGRSIARVRELLPRSGAILLAEAELLPPASYSERITLLERAIGNSVDEPLVHARYSKALMKVGRLSEAVEAARRAAALAPFSLESRNSFIATLAHAGGINMARRELALAERIWPRSELLASTRFSMELRYGDPRVAQQMIDRGEATLGSSEAPRILMEARLEPTPENIRRMVQLTSIQRRRSPQALPLRIQALGHAQANTEFYSLVEQPIVVEHLQDATEILFRPHLQTFRFDERFIRLAERLGLWSYWESTGNWPDFCRDGQLPYSCSGTAAAALTRRTG